MCVAFVARELFINGYMLVHTCGVGRVLQDGVQGLSFELAVQILVDESAVKIQKFVNSTPSTLLGRKHSKLR